MSVLIDSQIDVVYNQSETFHRHEMPNECLHGRNYMGGSGGGIYRKPILLKIRKPFYSNLHLLRIIIQSQYMQIVYIYMAVISPDLIFANLVLDWYQTNK